MPLGRSAAPWCRRPLRCKSPGKRCAEPPPFPPTPRRALLPPPRPRAAQVCLDWLEVHHIYTDEQVAQIEANAARLQARAATAAAHWQKLSTLNRRGKC
jgi:hypothetical protein